MLRLRKRARALSARKRPLSCVPAHVLYELRRAIEALAASRRCAKVPLHSRPVRACLLLTKFFSGGRSA